MDKQFDDETLVGAVAVCLYAGVCHHTPDRAREYWPLLDESQREDWRENATAVLTALSQDYAIVPLNSSEERDAAADLAMCEALEVDRWTYVGARTEYGGEEAWIEARLTHDDDKTIGGKTVFNLAKALPYWIKRCLQAEAKRHGV